MAQDRPAAFDGPQGPPQVPPGRARVLSSAAVVLSAKHDSSPALREIAPRAVRAEREPHEPMRFRRALSRAHLPDPVLQTTAPGAAAPSPVFNFEGVNNLDGVLPPDTNGDIGPNHYVQWVNKTFAVYSRTGSLLYGPAAGRTIWAGFGGPCETQNDGDPIVQYDHLADRWILTQFALPNNLFGIFLVAPFYQCIAVSQTPDPTGAYYRYQFEFSKLNDYPKLGVWSDGYYMTINQFASVTLEFAGQGVIAFERAAMLAGQPARMIYFDLSGVDPNLGGMLPSDLDGPAPPPGSPNYFAQVDDDAAGYAPDQIQLWRFHADWASPASSTFTGPFAVPVAAFDSNLCGYARECIPQPGTTAKLDTLADRLMYRLQYRNFGTHESLVVNHSVDVDGTDRAGIRWYEIRNPGGTPVVAQQGTYSPDPFHRWMGSAAMDAAGNLAVAFNVSSSTLAPSIRYAARLATDPPGILGQGENDLITGTGSQTHTASRWGDYSMLAVDPTDGCTFWVTAEYYAVTSLAGWQTRVGAFRLPGCGVTVPPPSAPGNLTASAASETRINLTWTDQSSDEVGFTVERCAGTAAACGASGVFSPIGQTAANATSYSDTPLPGSTSYSYRVRAFNFGGNSDYSNIADATTQPALPPPTITITASTPTATEAGPASGAFTISRGTPRDSATTVSFSVSGTATSGTDYQSVPVTATIPAGAASVDVPIVPVNDTVIETNETVVLSLSAGSTYVVGSPASATVTIVSDDLSRDLLVTALTVPQVAGAGVTIQVTDVTKNQGTDASGPSVTSFYLSVNASLDAGDTLLGTRAVPDLAPGATNSGATSLTLPATVATGTYTIFAKADGPDAITETQEYNNLRTASVRIGPDLTVTALTVPAVAGSGTSIVVTDTTTNQGGSPAPASSTRFYLSVNFSIDAGDAPLQSRSVTALAAGGPSSGSTTLTIPAGTATGLYYVIAKADDANEVGEPLETNNTRSGATRIGADLTIAVLGAPQRAALGSTIVVTDTTRNSGGGAAGASATAFYLSANFTLGAGDIPLAPSRNVGPLNGGESSPGSTNVGIPSNVAPGIWYLLANADAANAVVETTETNNVAFRSIYLGPDLTVTLFTTPSTATVGSTISVSDTVQNIGADPAGASVTRFYLSLNTTLDASDTLLEAGRSVGTLNPNQTSAGPTALVLPAGVTGRYYLLAVADGTGVVAESLETNNATARLITINP
jgi:subtilase family serine protease